MKIEIFGPNLSDQRKGQFHVHAADCGDCKHYGPRGKFGGETGWKIEADSKLAVSEEIHCDILGDYGLTPEDAEGREMLLDWLSEIWFAPCIKLPKEGGPEC